MIEDITYDDYTVKKEDRRSEIDYGYEANSLTASMMLLYVEEAIHLELLKQGVERIVDGRR